MVGVAASGAACTPTASSVSASAISPAVSKPGRPVAPLGHVLQHLVGDPGDGVLADLRPVRGPGSLGSATCSPQPLVSVPNLTDDTPAQASGELSTVGLFLA